MMTRTNYEMTEEDLSTLKNACKPVTCIKVGNYTPMSPQTSADKAWFRLGIKMGFDYKTVEAIEGKGERFFSAISTESEESLKHEKEETRLFEIDRIETEIKKLQKQVDELKNNKGE